jgi:hypothetical protein
MGLKVRAISSFKKIKNKNLIIRYEREERGEGRNWNGLFETHRYE